MTSRWRVTALLVGLLSGVVWLQKTIEAMPPLPVAGEGGAVVYVRSSEALKRIVLSYDALAADVYWIRTIQHYGGTRLSTDPNKTYALLYPLLDLTTSLDPNFNLAYRFGAIFLSEPFPNGPDRSDLAITLLQKGLAAQPGRWEFAQDIGFVHYWWRRDYKAAAEWFLTASKIEGAPAWLAPLAAVTLAEGGNRASSRQLWLQVYTGAEVDWLRSQASRRLQQLDAMDQLDELRRMARDYERRLGVALRSWEDLVRAGYLRALPVDPEGYPYQLDAAHASIGLASDSPLNPLPVEPRVQPTGAPGR